MESETYYTVAEAARKLRLHPETLRRWMRAGKVPAKRVGRQWRVSAKHLEAAGFLSLESDRFALAHMRELWDNTEDAIYDHWKELYGVSTR